MARHSRFIQITASLPTNILGQGIPALYALDDEGSVWVYRHDAERGQKRGWQKLSDERL
jgi:hypothetical protein